MLNEFEMKSYKNKFANLYFLVIINYVLAKEIVKLINIHKITVLIIVDPGIFTSDVPNMRRISCRQYYAYKLQIRHEDCSYLLRTKNGSVISTILG